MVFCTRCICHWMQSTLPVSTPDTFTSRTLGKWVIFIPLVSLPFHCHLLFLEVYFKGPFKHSLTKRDGLTPPCVYFVCLRNAFILPLFFFSYPLLHQNTPTTWLFLPLSLNDPPLGLSAINQVNYCWQLPIAHLHNWQKKVDLSQSICGQDVKVCVDIISPLLSSSLDNFATNLTHYFLHSRPPLVLDTNNFCVQLATFGPANSRSASDSRRSLASYN